MGNDKIEQIKLSELNDKEINELLLYNGRLFFLAGEEVYCEDYVLDIYLHFDSKNNTWEDASENHPTEDLKDYDFNLALFRFKDNPPWPFFDKVLEIRRENSQKYAEKLQKTNYKKVIGWISEYDIYKFFEDRTETGFLAVAKDIKDKGWFCTGMEYINLGLFPLLNTHQYVTFSTREWGAVMAAANGQYGQMDYAKYAFGFSDELFDDDPNYPSEGIYKKDRIKDSIFTSDSAFDLIESHAKMEVLKEHNVDTIYFLLPDFFVDGVYYEKGKTINVVSKSHKDVLSIYDIFYVENESELEALLEYLSSEYYDGSLILCEKEAIVKMLNKGPIYLLSSMIM